MKRLAHRCCLAIALVAFMAPLGVNAATFRHPGILNNKEELDFIRDRVQAGAEPWKSAFAKLSKSRYASLDYTPKPRAVVEARPYSRPDIGAVDLTAACSIFYRHLLQP